MALIETSVGWAEVFILEEPGSRSTVKENWRSIGLGFEEYCQKLKLVHFGFRFNFSDYQFQRANNSRLYDAFWFQVEGEADFRPLCDMAPLVSWRLMILDFRVFLKTIEIIIFLDCTIKMI